MKPLAMACVLALVPTGLPAAEGAGPVWPAAPDTARVAYVDEFELKDFNAKSGFLGKMARTLGGKSEGEELGFPFDVVRVGNRLYLTCQNIPGLIEVFLEEGSFRVHSCKELPPVYPIGLCRQGDAILLTDSEGGVVYRFKDGELKPFITTGLTRPTGVVSVGDKVFVVDTSKHTIHVFDLQGNPMDTVVGKDAEPFHFPTFAAVAGDDLLINDSLNYRIRKFAPNGDEVFAFGQEGDGPGSLARPKDLAVDTDGHVYIVDTLFDNIQVFDDLGQLLLVIGGQGSGAGEFWSPSGIDIVGDTLYVADTYNHRIQILRYLGGS